MHSEKAVKDFVCLCGHENLITCTCFGPKDEKDLFIDEDALTKEIKRLKDYFKKIIDSDSLI